MSDIKIQSSKDFFYSDEELSELKKRAISDHISLIALNRYSIDNENTLSELYSTLMIKIKTQIIDPVKEDSFEIQEKGSIAELMCLFDRLPKIIDGMSKLRTAKESISSPQSGKKDSNGSGVLEAVDSTKE